MGIKIGVLTETIAHERRVAMVPKVAKALQQQGITLLLQSGCGEAAGYPDNAYEAVEFSDDVDTLLASIDVLFCVQMPPESVRRKLKPNTLLIGALNPTYHTEEIAQLNTAKINSFSLELIPRITRAQAMDILSSQATVAGYQAALIAASLLPTLFPMLTTAAGTIRPARTLIIGAGVAGLQAIATCQRLGAIVSAYDIRPAAREQVQSLGAKMVDTGVTADGSGGYARALTAEETQRQRDVLASHLTKADVVISTAAIPGKPAPKIIDRAMVEGMQAGSVIVDIAAETSGNCELTQAGETILHHGVTIAGPVNLAASKPRSASDMYAKNLANFLQLFIDETGQLHYNFGDEIVAQSVLTYNGQLASELTATLGETS